MLDHELRIQPQNTIAKPLEHPIPPPVPKEVERGSSIEAVAKRHGVRPRTLVWWRWKAGQGARKSRANARLLPVVVRQQPVLIQRPAVVELAIRDVALRLETGTDVRYVAALVGALRSSC